MSDSQRVPDGSADAQQRAGATEDYGGVPISEQELAQVWTTGEGDDSTGATTESASGTGAGDQGVGAAEPSADGDPGDSTVASADPGEAGDTKPEVPQDDPAPTEPS